MNTQYVVCDEEGNISWSDKTEKPETFSSFGAAEKRAKGLAKLAPGQTIRIYELSAEVIAPTSAPKTLRKS